MHSYYISNNKRDNLKDLALSLSYLTYWTNDIHNPTLAPCGHNWNLTLDSSKTIDEIEGLLKQKPIEEFKCYIREIFDDTLDRLS
jgi:hypothetical protein